METSHARIVAIITFLTMILTSLGTINVVKAGTLDEIRARGHLICGVNVGLLGFADQKEGKWEGFDVDFCRAVAVAVFGEDERVEYLPLSAEERFDALRDGKVDLLSRNSTWTLSRETRYGLTFAGVSYYDGQGFMVPRSSNLLSSLELGGNNVCVLKGTTSEANLPDYFVENNMKYETVALSTSTEAVAAYENEECQVITSDMSQLYAWRLQLSEPSEQVILPDAISKEPLGPVVRQDDPAWATFVKWVLFALINAEEMGISSDTIGEALVSNKPAIRRFLGIEGELGSDLGTANDWTVQVIKIVGNYGEIFDRNLGDGSSLGIARGMNQLWNLGGILYAPPYR